MNTTSTLTPYSEVNAALSHFDVHLHNLLGSRFIGLYVVGSLALGDFNPDSSDIDFIAVIDGQIDESVINKLRGMHADFAATASPWAARIEAVYVTPDAFDLTIPNSKTYPQVEVEKGTILFNAPLEDGWVFQLHSLREHSLVVSGADPHTLMPPTDRKFMPPAVAAISKMWLDDAANDPTWIDWLRVVPNQQFVLKTLCRMLYSLATGDVCSKPPAVRWGQAHLPSRWVALLETSLASASKTGLITDALVDETIAFVRYTHERSQAEMNGLSL